MRHAAGWGASPAKPVERISSSIIIVVSYIARVAFSPPFPRARGSCRAAGNDRRGCIRSSCIKRGRRTRRESRRAWWQTLCATGPGIVGNRISSEGCTCCPHSGFSSFYERPKEGQLEGLGSGRPSGRVPGQQRSQRVKGSGARRRYRCRQLAGSRRREAHACCLRKPHALRPCCGGGWSKHGAYREQLVEG